MSEMMTTNKKTTVLKLITEVLIPLLLLIVFTRLFYLQIANGAFFRSDIKSHIKFALRESGYSLLYRVMGLIISVAGEENKAVAIGLFEGLMTTLTIYPMAGWMRKRFGLSGPIAFMASTGMLFFASIYLPVIQPLFYRSGIVTQPWHNITYLGMRLFAALTMYFFSDVLDRYQERIGIREWIAIAVPLAVSTGAKPVFLLAFSWTLLIFLIADAVRNRFRWKALLQCVKLGTTVFPSLVVLLIQSKSLYGSGSSGILFSLSASTFFSSGLLFTLIKLLRGLLLAVLVMLHNSRSDKRKATWFVYALYLMALFQVIFFSETGPRANDGNFYWIQYICGFVLYGQVVACWISNMKGLDWRRTREKWYGIVTSGLLLAHFASGIGYFIVINLNGQYFI